MKKALRWLVPMGLGFCLGALTTVATVGYLRQRRAVQAHPPVPAVTVNGESVPMGDFENQLKLTAGPRLLQSLVEQKLIQQEAARKKIQISPKEREEIDTHLKSLKQPELQNAARIQMETALLEHHLLMQGVTPKEVREVYDLFRPQLIQYEIFAILLGTHKDAHDVARSLEDGVRFDLLAKNYSLDPSKLSGGRLGFLTMPQIRRFMGAEAASAVARLKPNQVGGVVYGPQGWLVLKVGAIQSSYEEIKPNIEALVANSKKVELMAKLMEKAKVSSPYLKDPPSAIPEEKPQGILPGTADPHYLPKPTSSAVPHAQRSLPQPEPQDQNGLK